MSSPSVTIDDIDLRIVSALLANGRLSIQALAEEVHISRSQAYVRLDRLNESGVIQKYSAVVSPEKIGLTSSAFVAMTVHQPAASEIIEALRELPYVHSQYTLASAFEILVLVRTPNQAMLRDTVLQELGSIPGVLSTKTWFIFSEEHHDRLPGAELS